MADEVADVCNKKQLVACLSYVDKDFAAHEEFIGIPQVASIQSDVLIFFGVLLGQCVLQHTDNVRKHCNAHLCRPLVPIRVQA